MRVLPLVSFLMAFICQSVFASVVMTGTRIIYPAGAKEKTIQLKNADNTPYIVQMQVESAGESAAGKNIPFVVTPQIFRMEAQAGQSVRIINTGGGNLPGDRESMFMLSFSQLPAINKSEVNGNKLVFAITNRVKVFYRPEILPATADIKKIAGDLTFRIIGNALQVSNPGGYYVSVRSASLLINNSETFLARYATLAPKSVSNWNKSVPLNTLSGARIRLTLVNDFGVDEVVERRL